MLVDKSKDSGKRRMRVALLCASTASIAVLMAIGCSDHGLPHSGAAEGAEAAVVAATQEALVVGQWTQLSNAYPSGAGPSQIQLLMDGSILANDRDNTVWRRFIPDPVSGYSGGTWVNAAATVYGRRYFATGMLLDGRYLICGGEYVNLNGAAVSGSRNRCEIYDPKVNYPTGQWTSVSNAPVDVGDGIITPGANGKLLLAGLGDTTLRVFDPAQANPWSSTAALPAGLTTFNEGTMTQLQNGKSFFFGRNGASVYSSSTQTWSTRIAPPANNPYGDVYAAIAGGATAASVESAPALTLYDGRVFVAGATGYNALYNPSTNTLVNVAETPGRSGSIHMWNGSTDLGYGTIGARMDENGQAVLPNGNVLAGVIRWDFAGTYKFYEYTPPPAAGGNGSFTDVSAGGPSYTAGNLLQTPLPDGSVLVANEHNSAIYSYRPSGAQLTSYGQPRITSIAGPVSGVYTITGTGLNGLTNGANRDDEGQNYTSFPVVWVTIAGQRRYCNVTSVSTASIAPGAAVTVKFTLPANLPRGTLTVGLSASGLQSANSFLINPNLSGPRGLLLHD